MKIIQTGTKYKIFDESVKTHELLPSGTYLACYTQQEGNYLILKPDIHVTEKTYGIMNRKVDKVFHSFRNFDRNLGVILSGNKGFGKSLFAKKICEKAISQNLPVILVNSYFPGIACFLESIAQECIVLFDEFDKTYVTTDDRDDQAELLSLFDGIAGGKKLFIVTCNELWNLNNYIVNRPGRFHYHLRFDYPTKSEIQDYLQDHLDPEYYGEIEEVVNFSRQISLNYDCLRSIAYEINQGVAFAEAISDLNILSTQMEEYNVVLHYDGGKTLICKEYRTNLFDGDTDWCYVKMNDQQGYEAADVWFYKYNLEFDVTRSALSIPTSQIHIQYEKYKNNALTKQIMNLKPVTLSFYKCESKNLHYVL